MFTREDLKDYRYSQEWIKGRFEYIEELRTQIEKITATLDDMPKGSRKVQDSMAEKTAQLVDSVDELLSRVVEEDIKQKQILKQLEDVKQPYRNILEDIYIKGKTLVEVASERNYSYRDVCRKHGTALNMFEGK